MSEYWKSTPKYWCKFCKTHIRDTKFERQQHEATGKHQIAIQRSLRDLHREREREDREKQRARDEVARLNGVVGGSAASSSSASTARAAGGKAGAAREAPRQATVEDRKRQLAQLAAMGVSVPDEYRREVAMVGDWQTVAVKQLDGEQRSAGDNDASGTLNVGVRKRKKDDDDEEDEGGAQRPKRGWGNTFKTYSSTAKGAATEDDIEALLSAARKPVVKKEEEDIKPDPDAGSEPQKTEHAETTIKSETPEESENVKPDPEASEATASAKLSDIPPVKTEDEQEENTSATKNDTVGVVFKKRKSKALRKK
ncbi:U1 zinc finger domain-containing protein [Phyllosticta citribraziliensis]|uniref:U1 zinc finger domain-containing protein n=1 Tax=Phyllosticta citribraziliensis TaxID=989973 RepID=A0ABR1LKT9_9PEZI